MKELLISDLHMILYGTRLESDPENWDVLANMAKAFLSHHELFFFDAHEMPDAECWTDMDVEKRFFDTCCPGLVPSVTAFEHVCNKFLDFDMWEQMLPIKKNIAAAVDIMPAIEAITCDFCDRPDQSAAEIIYTDLDRYLTPPTAEEIKRIVSPVKKDAA